MKPHKSTILIMLIGLLLVAFVAVMAQQTPQQTGEQKKTEAAMESCCKGDSCAMKKEGAEAGEAKEDCCGDSCKLHHENAKNDSTGASAKHDPAKHDSAKHDSTKHEGCCGESCDMAKHENNDNKTHKPDGSCCKAKQKDAKKEAKVN
jgi:hypothetical protein